MTWTVTLIPTEAVDDLWPTVAPLLAPAMEYAGGRIDMDSVHEWLLDRRYLLWVTYAEDKIIRAAFVTREARYPRRNMLVIDICGGTHMRRWAAEGTRVFTSFARDVGLDGVEMCGRAGWTRSLRPYGWSDGLVILDINAASRVN